MKCIIITSTFCACKRIMTTTKNTFCNYKLRYAIYVRNEMYTKCVHHSRKTEKKLIFFTRIK